MTPRQSVTPRAAGLALSVGLVTLVTAATLFGTLLIPQSAGLGIWAVWIATVIALAAGVYFAVRDVTRLANENAALASIPAVGTIEVFERAVGGDGGPFADTLAADRVKRVAQAHALGTTADAMRATFRADSVSRAATIGTVTRYLASTLLLLSVIGTFAGMKAALPGLYEAVQQSSATQNPARPSGADINGQNIHDALKHVADAFGANFLALVGALALSVMSFGAIVDRRRTLVALERVSEQRLYPLLRSQREIVAQAFVDQLKESLTDVGTVASQLRGLREAIDRFDSGTTRAIEAFQSTLNKEIRTEFLTAHRDIATRVGSVLPTLSRIASAAETSAVAYQGLVEGVRERDLGLREASETLRQASSEATSSITGVVGPLLDLATGVASATTEATRAFGLLENQTRAAADATTDLHDSTAQNLLASKHLAAQALGISETQQALRAAIDDFRAGMDESFAGIERILQDRELSVTVRQAAEAQATVATEIRELVALLRATAEAAQPSPTNGGRTGSVTADAEVQPAPPVFGADGPHTYADSQPHVGTFVDETPRARTSLFGRLFGRD